MSSDFAPAILGRSASCGLRAVMVLPRTRGQALHDAGAARRVFVAASGASDAKIVGLSALPAARRTRVDERLTGCGRLSSGAASEKKQERGGFHHFFGRR